MLFNGGKYSTQNFDFSVYTIFSNDQQDSDCRIEILLCKNFVQFTTCQPIDKPGNLPTRNFSLVGGMRAWLSSRIEGHRYLKLSRPQHTLSRIKRYTNNYGASLRPCCSDSKDCYGSTRPAQFSPAQPKAIFSLHAEGLIRKGCNRTMAYSKSYFRP